MCCEARRRTKSVLRRVLILSHCAKLHLTSYFSTHASSVGIGSVKKHKSALTDPILSWYFNLRIICKFGWCCDETV